MRSVLSCRTLYTTMERPGRILLLELAHKRRLRVRILRYPEGATSFRLLGLLMLVRVEGGGSYSCSQPNGPELKGFSLERRASLEGQFSMTSAKAFLLSFDFCD